MSVLSVLDATTLCGSSSNTPSAPVSTPPVRTRPAPAGPFSWWALARNPQALLVTGMLGAVVVKDAVGAVLTSR
jgi:hypothetical protein